MEDGQNLIDGIMRAWDTGNLEDGLALFRQVHTTSSASDLLFNDLLAHYRPGSIRPRILFVSHSSGLGGAERCLINAVESMAGLCDLHVVLPSNGPLVMELSSAHTHIVRYGWWIPNCHLMLSEPYQGAVDAVRDIIRTWKIDVVVSNTSVISCGAMAARHEGCPHVWYVHEFLETNDLLYPNLPIKTVYQMVSDLSDLVVGCSLAVSDMLTRYIKDVLVVPLQGALDKKFVNQSQRVAYPFPNSGIIATSGAAYGKGVLVSLDAMRYVNRRHPNYKLFFIGAGGVAYEELQTKIQWYGLQGCVCFTRFLQNMEQLWHQVDVAVFPSLSEAFGLALLEASALGVPTDSTQVGGQTEILENGVTGLVVPPNDPIALSEAICLLIENKEYAKRISENASATLPQRFSVDRFGGILRYWMAAILCKQIQHTDKPTFEQVLQNIVHANSARIPIINDAKDVVNELVWFGDFTVQEAVDCLRREIAHVGANVVADVERFHATPFQYDDCMETLYKEGHGFLFELYVSGSKPERAEIGQTLIFRLGKLAMELGVPRDQLKILMMGDGIGTDSIRLINAGFKIDFIGMYGSHAFNFARKRLGRYCQNRVQFKHSLVEIFEENGNSYDAVVALELLEHLPDPVAAIASIGRLLHINGVALIAEDFASVSLEYPTHLKSNLKYAGLTPFIFLSEGLRLEWFYKKYIFKPYEFRKLARVQPEDWQTLLMIQEVRDEMVKYVRGLDAHEDLYSQISAYLQKAEDAITCENCLSQNPSVIQR